MRDPTGLAAWHGVPPKRETSEGSVPTISDGDESAHLDEQFDSLVSSLSCDMTG